MKNVSDLQKAIFYTMENYDNWRDLPVFYQKDISKMKNEMIAFHAEIDTVSYEDDNFIFTAASYDENEELTICLESLVDIIDEMIDNNEENWMHKVLKFETPVSFEFETTENVMVHSKKDFDVIKDFFVNEECFILIGD